MSETLPLIMTSAGPQPTPVTTIQQTTINNATSLAPGLTSDLPGSLIEDLTDTSVAAIQQADQARVDAINAVTPLGANAFLLAAFGEMLGIPQGEAVNTSVAVVFNVISGGSPVSGFVIPAGVLVSDGTYIYATQTGVITQSGGSTVAVAAIATQSGSWAVAADAVNTVSTSFANTYTVTVANPDAGIAGTGTQTVDSYRAQILTAEQITVQGTGNTIYTLLSAINGVQSRLILSPVVSGGIEVICGLSVDQNLIAGAIYQAIPDVSTLQGSQLAIENITTASAAVIVTNEPSNLAAGATLTVTGATPSGFNTNYVVTAVNTTTITTSTNSSSFGLYSSGAVFNPNPRNVYTTVVDGPNTYDIVFVNPPNQAVTGTVTWNTNLTNFSASSQVNQAAQTALVNYINGIQVGQPINLLEMNAAFQNSVASYLPAQNIIAIGYTIDINGVTASPVEGTSIIDSDAESYFSAVSNAFTVTKT